MQDTLGGQSASKIFKKYVFFKYLLTLLINRIHVIYNHHFLLPKNITTRLTKHNKNFINFKYMYAGNDVLNKIIEAKSDDIIRNLKFGVHHAAEV